jgi:hypothetical protein
MGKKVLTKLKIKIQTKASFNSSSRVNEENIQEEEEEGEHPFYIKN